MTKLLLFIAFFAISAALEAQTPYLPTPSGWQVEQFSFPIEFAPQIPYSGDEHVRFAPGWGKTDNEESWTYCFLWWILPDSKISAESLGKDLQAYYDGLVARNIISRKIDKAKVVPTVAEFKEVTAEKGDTKTFTGTVKMLDYMGVRPVRLNLKVHQMFCTKENKMAVLVFVSPQPQGHALWGQFKMIKEEFRCSK